MAGINDYTDNILGIIGGGRDTSDYRTQAQQDALRAAGKTKTVHSSHTTGTPEEPGAIDVAGNPISPEEAAAKLHASGFPNAAVIYESGQGANNGTGPHLHVTLDSSVRRPGGGGTPTAVAASPSGPPIPGVLREQGSTTLPSGQNPGIVADPFAMAKTLPADLATANDRGRAADAMLQQVINTDVPANDAVRTATLTARNEAVHAANSEITDRTNSFLGVVKPLLQQKAAVADRFRQVTDMNPLERGFMSLFDASYDKDHLRAVDQAITGQLSAYGESYHEILDAQNTLLHVADSNYTADEQMNLLQRGFIDEKLDLASKSFASADTIITSGLKALGAQTSIIAAQNQLQDQVMTSLTPGQRATGLAAAQKSPTKTVTIQGATFTEGQLLTASQADAKQQVAIDEMVLSRQTAAMNNSMTAQRMADQAEEKLIGSLTTAQQREAIQNGGVYQGHQLSLDKLGQGLQSSMGRDQMMVAQTLQQGSTTALAASIQGMNNQAKLSHQRAMQLTGVAPPEMLRVNNQVAQEIQQIAGKITAAPPEQRDALAAQYAPRVQELYAAQQKAADQVAESWAGGNKKLKPLAQAFLSGSPLNSTSAVQGLIEMARTNGSFGGGMSGPAAEALATARRIVQDDAAPKAGTDMASLMATPQGRAEKEQKLESRVAAAITQTYQNAIFHRVIQNAPTVARTINHLGQQLDPEVLGNAITAGDAKGYETIAAQLGIKPDEAKALFNGGSEASPMWQHARHGDQSYGQWATQLQVAQQQQTYRVLDATHPKIGKYSAGAVYANLLGNPRFAQVAGSMAMQQGQASFGDSIMSSMGAGSIQGQVSQFGQTAMNAYRLMGQRDLLMRVARANQYGNDPIARTQTIVGAIPGINPQERDRFMAAVKTQFQGGGQRDPVVDALHGMADSGSRTDDTRQSESYRLERIITETKFQDPALEALRQKIAKQYHAYAQITDDAIDSLSSYQPGK